MVKTYNYAAVTGTCIFGDPATFINKDRRVLFGDIFIAPFLSSPGWGNLVAFDWNDLPVGRKFDGKFLKNVKSPRHPLPKPPAGITLIGALASCPPGDTRYGMILSSVGSRSGW